MQRADPSADIEESGVSGQWRRFDGRQELAGGRIGAASPEAPEVPPRDGGVKLPFGGITAAAGHEVAQVARRISTGSARVALSAGATHAASPAASSTASAMTSEITSTKNTS